DELVWKIAQVVIMAWCGVRFVQQAKPRQLVVHLARRGDAGIDQHHPVASYLPDARNQQRIMRAAEDERIDGARKERREVFARHDESRRMMSQPLLREPDEERACLRYHLRSRRKRGDGLLIRVR